MLSLPVPIAETHGTPLPFLCFLAHGGGAVTRLQKRAFEAAMVLLWVLIALVIVARVCV